jgi:hypothetical protein
MKKIEKFKELIARQKARKLAANIYRVTNERSTQVLTYD